MPSEDDIPANEENSGGNSYSTDLCKNFFKSFCEFGQTESARACVYQDDSPSAEPWPRRFSFSG